jgi:hypothetical protein
MKSSEINQHIDSWIVKHLKKARFCAHCGKVLSVCWFWQSFPNYPPCPCKPSGIIVTYKNRLKSFRQQTIDCDGSYNRFQVPCVKCEQVNLICAKYKCYCSSKVCLEERKLGGVKL